MKKDKKNKIDKKQQNEKEVKKESKGTFKKVLKTFGFVSLGVVGIIGVAFGIGLIKGSFSKEKINILSLSTTAENIVANNAPVIYTGDGVAEVVVMEGESLRLNLAFTPTNATQTTLSVKYINGKSLLEATPDTVTAGVPFTLKFKENSANNSGEVEIKFVNETKLVSFTLRVLVDKQVTDDDITYEADNSFVVKEPETSDDPEISTLSESAEMIKLVTARGESAKNIVLKGTTASSVAPKRGAVVFSDNTINSLSYKKPYTIIDTDENRLEILDIENPIEKNSNGTVDYKYGIKAVSSTSDARIVSYFPKTFAMQLDFTDAWLYNALNNNLTDYPYTQLEEYINKYFDFIFEVDELDDIEEEEEPTIALGEGGEEPITPVFTPEQLKQLQIEMLIEGLLEKDDETGLYKIIRGDGEERDRLVSIMQNIFVYIERSIVVYDIEVGEIDVKESITFKVLNDKISYNNTTVGKAPSDEDNYLGVSIIPADKSASDYEEKLTLLQTDIGRLNIAPYRKLDTEELGEWEEHSGVQVPTDKIAVPNAWDYDEDKKYLDLTTGEKVQGTDGNEYLKYIRFAGTGEGEYDWYEFDETKLRVSSSYTLEGFTRKTSWSITTLNPISEVDKDKYVLVYSFETVDEYGNTDLVLSKTQVKIEYSTPDNFGFSNLDVKMILNNNYTNYTSLQNTTGYITNMNNQLTFAVGDVVTAEDLSKLEYKNVRFFMVKSSNTYKVGDKDYEIFDSSAWKECKLTDVFGAEIKVGNEADFYDLGTNPTLTAINVSSFDESNKVKIFACIIQSDIDGEVVVKIEYDSNDPSVEKNRVYSVAYDGSSRAQQLFVDHFASSIFTYVEIENYYIPTYMTIESWVNSLNMEEEQKATLKEQLTKKDIYKIASGDPSLELNMYISAYERDKDGKIISTEDGVCTEYLNKRALENLWALWGNRFKYTINFDQTTSERLKANNTTSKTDDEYLSELLASIIEPINSGDFEYDNDNAVVKFTITINQLTEKMDSFKVSVDGSGDIQYGTKEYPLGLDYRFYMLPDNKGTDTPYYNINSSQNWNIKFWQEIANQTADPEPEIE